MRPLGVLLLIAAQALAQKSAALSEQEQAAVLKQIRDYALNYTKRLPNFTCVQATTENTEFLGGGTPRPGPVRKIEQQLSYFDFREHYKVTRIDGQRVNNLDPRQLPDRFSSFGEYGTLLEHIFDPGAGTEFHYSRLEKVNGRPVYEFTFAVPALNGYALIEPKRTIRVAFQGRVFADVETKAVVRIDMRCVDIPGNSDYRNVDLKVDYALTGVAGKQYMLPAHYRMHVSQNDGTDAVNEAVYKQYRRYDASSSISFGDKSGDTGASHRD
jgi:hypothetical protein